MVADAVSLSYPVDMPGFEPLEPSDAEAALRAVEAAFGVTITVRDLTGWMRGNNGELQIDPRRNSHQRQPVCARGFAPACIAHCRTATTAALLRDGLPLVQTCWKQVREVVVPVIRGGSLQGYLFAGAWRAPGPAPVGPWRREWGKLAPWSATRAARVGAALGLIADALWEAAARARTAPGGTDRASRIRAFIRAHLADGSGRPALARHLGLSAERTSHAVREACGTSLQELVAAERLAAAQRLLAEGQDPVAEVGARVGWGDPPHFARTFKRLTGLPPGAWRERHRLA